MVADRPHGRCHCAVPAEKRVEEKHIAIEDN